MKMDQVAQAILQDLESFLQRVPAAAYTQKLDLLSEASMGQHTRHLIEFFQCLIRQVPQGIINYDARQRNQQIELSHAYAAEVIQDLLPQLAALDLTKPLTLEVDYHTERAQIHRLVSTCERELVYNIEHAIHHMALIKVGAKLTCPELELPEGFGVAPSTLRYWRSQVAHSSQ